MKEIGEKLKKARKEKNLTIEKISGKTKIRKKYLIAIEKGNYEIIPAEIYIKAFIREYANQVGLNGKKMVDKYEKRLQQIEKNKKKEEEKIAKEKEVIWQKELIKIIILLLIVSIVFFVSYKIFVKQPEKSNTTIANNNQLVEQQQINTSKQKNQQDINNKKTIKVIANEKSWVQIYIDGEKSFQGFMNKGDIKKLTGKESAVLKIGNGIAIEIEKNGELLGPWGEQGEVVKKEVDF